METTRVLWVRAQYLEVGDRVYDQAGVLRRVTDTLYVANTGTVYFDLELDGVVTKEHAANLYCLNLTATYGEKIT